MFFCFCYYSHLVFLFLLINFGISFTHLQIQIIHISYRIFPFLLTISWSQTKNMWVYGMFTEMYTTDTVVRLAVRLIQQIQFLFFIINSAPLIRYGQLCKYITRNGPCNCVLFTYQKTDFSYQYIYSTFFCLFVELFAWFHRFWLSYNVFYSYFLVGMYI